MKNKSKELDVDFIGVQGQTLTNAEQEAISNYIRLQKTKKKITARRTGRSSNKKKITS